MSEQDRQQALKLVGVIQSYRDNIARCGNDGRCRTCERMEGLITEDLQRLRELLAEGAHG